MKKPVNTYYCVFLMVGFGSFTTPKLNFCHFSEDRNQISSSTSFFIGFLFDFDSFLGFLDRSMCFQSEYVCFFLSEYKFFYRWWCDGGDGGGGDGGDGGGYVFKLM